MKTKSKHTIGRSGKKITLSVECENCQGEGYFTIDDNPKGRVCNDCDGTGCWATKDGIELLDFISRTLINPRRRK